MKSINLFTYFSERQLKHCPKHFVSTNAVVTDEALEWINERLQGRFYIESTFFLLDRQASFEDPSEAVLFELTWSS